MNQNTQKYYSNGKLLLTGEYLVLKGAKALAFPTRYGQDLTVNYGDINKEQITWKAYEPDGLWFEACLNKGSFSIISTNDMEAATYLSFILENVRKLNPNFLSGIKNELIINTHTDFPINWGLGTSSTLISNISQWAKINAFDLHKAVSKGSGYDIACATASSPIKYHLHANTPVITPISFNKSFLDNLWFIYSGKKKRTEDHIQHFLKSDTDFSKEVETISALTDKILNTESLNTLISLLQEHENCIGNILQWKPISEDRFACFNGVIKSLGAWGGDFLLVVSTENEHYVRSFFEQNGLSCIIPYKDMIYIR